MIGRKRISSGLVKNRAVDIMIMNGANRNKRQRGTRRKNRRGGREVFSDQHQLELLSPKNLLRPKKKMELITRET